MTKQTFCWVRLRCLGNDVLRIVRFQDDERAYLIESIIFEFVKVNPRLTLRCNSDLILALSVALEEFGLDFGEKLRSLPSPVADEPLRLAYAFVFRFLTRLDPLDTMGRDIRQRALQKLASLSAGSSPSSFDRSDFDRLCKACHTGLRSRDYTNGHPAAATRIPMV
jgi:hypothetical protein